MSNDGPSPAFLPGSAVESAAPASGVGAAPSAAAPARVPRFDPEQIPFDPSFADPEQRGSVIASAQLSSLAVRQRFQRPPVWQPEITADTRLEQALHTPRPASVLIPLVQGHSGLSVLLTRRTAHLHDHAGQISFPGGRMDPGDRDVVHTALREAHEEIGLHEDLVDVLGSLPLYVTVTGYAVTPVVGLIEQPFALRLDSFEVDEAFEVPLVFLMDPANHERRQISTANGTRSFYAMPYEQSGRRYFIWGATAAMLRNLYHFMRA